MRHKLRSALRNEMHGGMACGLRWLLRDEFTTDRAAGAVNGTAAEPGPGTRTVADAGSAYSILSGKFTGVGDSVWKHNRLLYPGVPIARIAGRMLITKFVTANSGVGYTAGFATNTDPDTNFQPGFRQISLNDFGWYDGVNAVVIAANSLGTTYSCALLLRASGGFCFLKTSGNWLLRWVGSSGNTATLYPTALSSLSLDSATDFIRIPDALWLPTPIVSYGFGGTYGTSDGLGHAEGIAGGIGAGGSGVTWSNAGGTWSTSGGKAINTSPSGLVQQISVANLSCADVYAGASVVRALSQQVGLALNWDSASSPANGLLVYSDGAGNIKVDKYVSGSPTNVSTTAFTYSAGARLVVQKSGTEYRVYYNNALITTQTISDAGIVNNTLHGLFSTDASNTLDDLTIYATGTNDEYAALDAWSS